MEYAKTLVSSDNRKFELVIEKLEQSRLLAERHLEETLKEKEEFEKYRKDLTLRLEREKAESEKLLEKRQDHQRLCASKGRRSQENCGYFGSTAGNPEATAGGR